MERPGCVWQVPTTTGRQQYFGFIGHYSINLPACNIRRSRAVEASME